MCTSVSVISEDGTHVMGRTMDWYDLYVKPMYIPRGYQWKSAFDNKKYTNKYAIVGGGFQDNNYIDLSDGVNECGLMAQKLTFSNGAQLVMISMMIKSNLKHMNLLLIYLEIFLQ